MNEARLREEIRRLVNEQRQLNRRLQQQRMPAVAGASSSSLVGAGSADESFSFSLGHPFSGGGAVSVEIESGSSRNGGRIRRRSISPEQQERTLLQQQHRMAGSGDETASASFSARAAGRGTGGKVGSCSFPATSSGNSGHTRRGERDEKHEVSLGLVGAGDGSCNIPARALVAERLLAMGIPAGEASVGKRPLAPGERPIYDFHGPEFQVEKRPKLKVADEKTVTRDRRMFGALAGHLRRAQQQLQREQGTDWAHKHKQQEERVAQKLALSQKNIAEIARLEWEEKRQQERLRLEEVSMELVNKENELMRVHLVKHYKNMERFIGTEAQPTLFWLPAKWDDVTRRLQEQTRLWIQTKIDHIQSTDYTYRPQQSCNGTIAAAVEEEGDSAVAEEGAGGATVAAGLSKAAETANESADSKVRETYPRAERENSAAGFSTSRSAAGATAVTPASSVSPSTDSSTSAAVGAEGGATDTHCGGSSAVRDGRAVSRETAREGESAAAEPMILGTAGNIVTPEDKDEKSAVEKGPPESDADTRGGTDATTERSHVDRCARRGNR